MKKALVILIVLASLAMTVSAQASQEYPSRDISDVVTWSAGGGTDLANRLIAAEMEKVLGTHINVSNVTGGVSGSTGLYNAYEKGNDGYTIVGLSESNVSAAVMGGFDKGMKVWDFFIIGGSPDILSVTADSPYNTLEELVEAAKAVPGTIRVGAGGVGSIHHLNLVAFQKGTGTSFNFIPYDGSSSSQNAALTGEVTICITSAQEQADLIRAGMLRPLAVLTEEDFTVGDITIETAFTSYPELENYLPISQQIGFAVRADVDSDVKAALEDAFKKAMQSETVQNFGKERYFIMTGLCGDEAKETMLELERLFSWTLYEFGAANKSPSQFGIEKP